MRHGVGTIVLKVKFQDQAEFRNRPAEPWRAALKSTLSRLTELPRFSRCQLSDRSARRPLPRSSSNGVKITGPAKSRKQTVSPEMSIWE